MTVGRGRILCRLVGLSLFVAACGGGGGGGAAPGGGGYHFVSMGTGEENTKPLNPLRYGSVFGTGRASVIADGYVDLPSGRALRLTEVLSGVVTYVAQKPEGLFVLGGTLDGLDKGSELIVPAKVRLGMKWTTTLVGGGGDTFEVTAREPNTASQFGPVTKWTIERTDGDGNLLASKSYLEGYGSESSPPTVLPAEDVVVAPETAPKVTLTPIPTPDSFRGRGWVETIGLVRANESVGGMFVVNDELEATNVGFCGMYDGTTVTAMTPSPGKPFRRTTGPACVTTTYCVKLTTMAGGRLDCSITYASGQASGVSIGLDGTYTWIARANEGGLAYADFERAGSDFSETAYRTLAALPDDKGVGQIVYNHFGGFGDLVAIGGPELLGEANPPSPKILANNLVALEDLTAAIPLGDSNGGRRTMLLQTADGMLWSSRIGGDVVEPPVRYGRFSGELSVQASEHGNEVLRVTGDGLVQRLSVDAQGLALEPVAKIDLPPREVAVGAFLYREADAAKLIVATLTPDGSDGVLGSLVRLNLYKSSAAVTPGAAVRVPAALGLRANAAGYNYDGLVCWTGAEGPPDPTGWTIGGQPAAAVVPVTGGGPCAMVVRPPGQGMPGLSANFTAVEGPIPGVGRVTVQLPLNPNLRVDPGVINGGEIDRGALAPLKGGGMVSGRRLYGSGGVARGVPIDPLTADAFRFEWIDAAGNGVWLSTMDEANEPLLRRVGLTSARTSFPDLVPDVNGVKPKPTIEFLSGGGGVVVKAGPAEYYVAPDGTKTMLPAPKTNRAYMGRLADGTLCGIDGSAPPSIFCVPPAGAEVTSPLPAGVLSIPDVLPGAEGVFLFKPNTGLPYAGIDPKTATLIGIAPATYDLVSWCPAADGSLWGVVSDSAINGNVYLVKLTRNGVQRVEIPAALIPRDDQIVRVVPDEDVLLLIFRKTMSYAIMARPK
jgi:hypothetical protein